MRQHVCVPLAFLSNTNQWLSLGGKGKKEKEQKKRPSQMDSFLHTPCFFRPFSALLRVSTAAELRYQLIVRSASPGQERAASRRWRKEMKEWEGMWKMTACNRNDSSTKVNHTVVNIHLSRTSNYGSNTSSTMHIPNNSPLLIRPITVNSKYLLLSADEYRPKTVAVLFGCNLNVESKYTSFSIGSPKACCKKFSTTRLLE